MPDIGAQAPASPSEAQIDHILEHMADGYGRQVRSPIMHRPSEQELVV